VFQRDARGGEAIDQRQHLVRGLGGRCRIEQLRADVAVDAPHRDMRQVRGATVDIEGFAEGDAEFCRLEPGGDVGMGFRVDVRIHAQRHRCAAAEAAGDFVELVQLAGGFDVEAVDARLQRRTHLGARLADAGEHYFARTAASGQHARQLATGNDVEAGAEPGEKVQDGEVGIGLDRVADQRSVGQAVGLQRVAVGGIGRGERGTRIDVAWRAEARGDVAQCDGLDVQSIPAHRGQAHRTRLGGFVGVDGVGPTAA
jgi:hypothetical protein